MSPLFARRAFVMLCSAQIRIASSRAIRPAFEAKADGVVLSREYVEMWLANLSAAGDTLREIFGKPAV